MEFREAVAGEQWNSGLAKVRAYALGWKGRFKDRLFVDMMLHLVAF